MNFLGKIAKWLEYGSAELVKDFGRIFEGNAGREQFTAEAKLLQEDGLWLLRLDLKRRWGSTGNRQIVDCYFRHVGEIRHPFAALLQDVNAGHLPERSGQIGAIPKMLVSVSAGKVLRQYGRIDNHPKNDPRFLASLYLSQQKDQFWMLISLGKASVEWGKWPIGIPEAVCDLLEKIEKTG